MITSVFVFIFFGGDGANRPSHVGETSRWRNVQRANRPGGETSWWRIVLVANRPEGETSTIGGETSKWRSAPRTWLL